ncbi:hypothetical protein Pan54_37890 [Rubinisphaera italica]|uniref:Uncharacterized protein n=1 Tax=Rubinisphaera italica TaxID=2527969 RepID=A0A5C5XK14_9PLAN|nr:hypothetical protein Pan54_37890 [Rubinisphaera italica]
MRSEFDKHEPLKPPNGEIKKIHHACGMCIIMSTAFSFTRKHVWINERRRKSPEISCQQLDPSVRIVLRL